MDEDVLHAVDLVIFGSMLVVSLLIGLFYAIKDRRSETGTEGYLMANRSMSFLPVGVSLAVNFQSSILLLGVPADVYHYGMTYLWMVVALVLAFIFVGLVFVPTLYGLRITSAYQYLHKRFNKIVCLTASSMYVITNTVYVGVNIYGPALALSGVTGFQLFPAMLTTGTVCVIYTSLGGLRGVIWADVFQASLMVFGMLSVIIRGSILFDGFDRVWNIASEGGRTFMLNFNPDPRIRYTGWSMTFGILGTWIGVFGTNQAQVQRISSAKSQKAAVMALAVGIFGMTIFTVLAVTCGLIAYTLYYKCDPIIKGCISKKDEIFPFAVMNIFKGIPGLPGLFLSCVYSASLSTVSTGMNSMVTVIMADFIKPYTILSESVYTWLARGVTVFCGVIALGIAFLASVADDIVGFGIASCNMFVGPSLGIFILGLWCPFANSWGALAAMVIGFASEVVTFAGGASLDRPYHLNGFLELNSEYCPENCDYSNNSNQTYSAVQPPTRASVPNELHGLENLYALSVFYLSSLGTIVTLIVGILVSLLTGGWKKRHGVKPHLLSPPFDLKIFRWIPERIRVALRCGVEWETLNQSGSTMTEKNITNPYFDDVM